MLFQEITVMGLVATIALIVLHVLISRRQPKQGQYRQAVNEVTGWARGLRPLRFMAGWVVVLAVAFLTFTGWSGVWQAQALTGYTLMAHVTAGGGFAVAFAAWVVLTAGRYPLLDASPQPCTMGQQKRFCFWLLVLLSLPVILSIVLNFFPLFSMHQQELVDACHRYSALAFVLVGLLFVYLALRTERKSKTTSHKK